MPRHLPAAVAALAIASLCGPAAGQPPKPAAAKVYPRGQYVVDHYFSDQVKRVADADLADVTTREAWEKNRPELRRQFFDMMGLWPLPAKTDLKATVTGTADGAGFTVEKLHFQSRPGLFVTANFYLPKARKPGQTFPTVLYVCGHGNVVEGVVSYGSKVKYQYHPAWFAAHGFACLVLDTVELGEIPGDHHGTYSRGMWWWQARGYTPAGVELWNAVRALDYLETRPEVDAKRIGVTGRSGGGATSWWVAAADDRVRVAVPVAGLADLRAHVVEGEVPRFRAGVIAGHCDCMFPVNTYRWDFARVAALVAPRPLLLGNTDRDDIFPVAGYRRLAEKVRKVYALYGADDKFALLEEKGPHEDTPELRRGINRWLARWLKADPTTEIGDELPPPLAPKVLKVFAKLPEDAINPVVHETFVKAAVHDLPASDAVLREWWPARRAELVAGLRAKVFAGWPTTPCPLHPIHAADVTAGGARLRAVDFTSETGVELRLFVLTAAKSGRDPTAVNLRVLDEAGWAEWARILGPKFADALLLDAPPDPGNRVGSAAWKPDGTAVVLVVPRGVGPTKWADAGSVADTQIRRRFPLLGQTLDGQRVWDVRRALAAVRSLPDLTSAPVTLTGEREAAGIAVFAGVFEPSVAGFNLTDLPPSHRTGPTFLNVATVLDVPQAVALLAPRPVTLRTKPADAAAWDWPLRVQSATAGKGLTVRAAE